MNGSDSSTVVDTAASCAKLYRPKRGAVIHTDASPDTTALNEKAEWSYETTTFFQSHLDAVKSIQGIYQSGLDNLKKLFGI